MSSIVATAVSATFAWRLLDRWRARGRTPATLLWGVAMGMFCVASLMLLTGVAAGWTGWTFRLFYLFGGVLNVAWLGLGSIAINARRRVVTRTTGAVVAVSALAFVPGALGPDPALWWPAVALAVVLGACLMAVPPRRVVAVSVAVVAVFSVVAAAAVATGPLGALASTGLPEGRELFGTGVRGLAVAGNAVGAVVVVAAALVSSAHLVWRRPDAPPGRTLREQPGAPVEAAARWLFSGRRGDRGAAHVVRGNLLIVLGVVIAAAGGVFSFLGDTAGHAVGLALGVVVMYRGFVRTTRPVTGPTA